MKRVKVCAEANAQYEIEQQSCSIRMHRKAYFLICTKKAYVGPPSRLMVGEDAAYVFRSC